MKLDSQTNTFRQSIIDNLRSSAEIRWIVLMWGDFFKILAQISLELTKADASLASTKSKHNSFFLYIHSQQQLTKNLKVPVWSSKISLECLGNHPRKKLFLSMAEINGFLKKFPLFYSSRQLQRWNFFKKRLFLSLRTIQNFFGSVCESTS